MCAGGLNELERILFCIIISCMNRHYIKLLICISTSFGPSKVISTVSKQYRMACKWREKGQAVTSPQCHSTEFQTYILPKRTILFVSFPFFFQSDDAEKKTILHWCSNPTWEKQQQHRIELLSKIDWLAIVYLMMKIPAVSVRSFIIHLKAESRDHEVELMFASRRLISPPTDTKKRAVVNAKWGHPNRELLSSVCDNSISTTTEARKACQQPSRWRRARPPQVWKILRGVAAQQ